MSLRAVAVLIFLTLVAGCFDDQTAIVDLRFVAHEDDDLLFMNPDLAHSIAAGNHVVTVFLSAGASDPELDYFTDRERGILNAYAYMVRPEAAVLKPKDESSLLTQWALHEDVPGTGTIRLPVPGREPFLAVQYDYVADLPRGGSLSTVFLRMPEWGSKSAGIVELWGNERAELQTLPCHGRCVFNSELPTQVYTRETVARVVVALMTRFHSRHEGTALVVSSTDGTNLYHDHEGIAHGDPPWVENPEHFTAGRFVTSAFIDYHAVPSTGTRRLQLYRGYSIWWEPENLALEDSTPKRRAFHRYDLFEPGSQTSGTPDDPDFLFNGYDDWGYRMYAVRSDEDLPATGRLMMRDEQCLAITSQPAGDRDRIGLGDCAAAPAWTFTADNQLQLAGSTPPRCVVVGDDAAVSVAPCESASPQQRTLLRFSNGQIRARGATCLRVDAQGARAVTCERDKTVGATPRRPIAAQDWTLR